MKDKLHLLFVSWLFMVSLPAAAQSAVPDPGQSRSFKSGYTAVWKATLQTLVDGGDTITSQDKESGTISTEWFTLKEALIVSRGWRVKQNLLVDRVSNAETRVTLKMNFQNRIGKNEWRPASVDNNYTPLVRKAFFENLAKRLGDDK